MAQSAMRDRARSLFLSAAVKQLNASAEESAVHSFNVKPIKMLSDPVAEAFGLIHRHPSGENFWYGNRQCNFRPLEDRYNVGITSSFFARE